MSPEQKRYFLAILGRRTTKEMAPLAILVLIGLGTISVAPITISTVPIGWCLVKL